MDDQAQVSISPRAFAAFEAETVYRQPWTVFASALWDFCEVYLPRTAVQALGAAGVITYDEAFRRYRLTTHGWAVILDTANAGKMLSSFLEKPYTTAGPSSTYTDPEETEETEPPLRITQS